MPHPPAMRRPNRRSSCFSTSKGMGAPPDPHSLSEDKFRFSMPGRLAMAIHIVGTPGIAVTRLISISATTASASKRGCSNSSLPSRRPRKSMVESA